MKTLCSESALPRVQSTLAALSSTLVEQLNAQGYWTGELSSSALSTAVAVIALKQMDLRTEFKAHAPWIKRGLDWLAHHVNRDGGWGDTVSSKSNLSTTALCWAAFRACDLTASYPGTVREAEACLIRVSGSLHNLPEAITSRYGRDRTFSVPILLTLAISGCLDDWRVIPALPFELAVLPRRFFGALRLPVVSYALPALIAIGQTIHHHAPSTNPFRRALRNWSGQKTLSRLTELQPENGGFLEATPLTAFVTMSLASVGNHEHVVALKGTQFLRNSIRADGSWPIDTNLSTWVTTLAVKALATQPAHLQPHAARLRSWLLGQQTPAIHPYTGAAPGGWAWTDLPGGVPDADDTAGALTALWDLGARDERTLLAVEAGVGWLLGVANRDGGIPTFCPGWGTLPFDRSAPDITVHALRAWCRWRGHLRPQLQKQVDHAVHRALKFLASAQHADGSFLPLWFGNQDAKDENNPVYGTAQVLIALNELRLNESNVASQMRQTAGDYLVKTQLREGGWGGDERAGQSIEETSVALEALAGMQGYQESVSRGLLRLLDMLAQKDFCRPTPIGLYFARLWYFERLYPLIFSVSALAKIATVSSNSCVVSR